MTRHEAVEGAPPSIPISVVEIRRRPGSRQPVDQELVARGFGLTDVSVPEGAAIRFVGELESIFEGVVLTGTAEVPWTGACRRCLRTIDGRASIEVREVYATKPVDGETWPLEHDHVDLGPLLHDISLLALPLAPLCAEDCRGPAPEAFPAVVADAALEPAKTAEPPKDPRWAALDDLDL